MSSEQDIAAAYLEDRPVLTRRQALVLGVSAPLLIAVSATWITRCAQLERLEDVTIDWRFSLRGPRPPPENIIIVEINEESRRALKRDNHRFNLRKHLGAAVDNLADAGALGVGLDVWLEDLTTPDIDEPLADVLSNANVVLAVARTGGSLKRPADLFRASEPMEGDTSVTPDAGVLRRLPARLYLNVLKSGASIEDREYLPHFPLALAWYAAVEEDPTARIHFEEDGSARIGTYSVRPRELIDFAATKRPADGETPWWKTLRFDDVVHGWFEAEAVDGAVVLIGEAGILLDSFVMPLSDGFVPGVYYHANALAHVLQRRRFESRWHEGRRRDALIAGLAFAAGLFAWNQRRWWRHRRSTILLLGYLTLGIVGFLGGWTYAAHAMFARNVLLPLAAPLACMGVALGTGLAAQWVIHSANTRHYAERVHRIETLFGQSVSENVLEAIKRDPDQIRRTETRDVSVLFCDLRNFTAQSAEMDPADVAAMLNEYFNYITAAVFEHDGFIDKFVGDEVMAVFSVPFVQRDHAERAVRTAIEIKRRLSDLNRVRAGRDQPPLECGLGIHCGPAAAGHIGSRQRSNYTVVGTTVNLAARIEQHTHHGEVLVSDAVRRKLPPDIAVRLWDRVEIRGAGGTHELFEVDIDDRRSQAPS